MKKTKITNEGKEKLLNNLSAMIKGNLELIEMLHSFNGKLEKEIQRLQEKSTT